MVLVPAFFAEALFLPPTGVLLVFNYQLLPGIQHSNISNLFHQFEFLITG